jgi:sporulation protein YlmC with PRC-barrel domain
MIKQLLAATAIVTIATAAQAAQPTAPSPAAGANAATTVLPATGQIFLPSAIATDHLATKLIGASVYESDSPDAQSIGTVNDIVIADNGAVSAVVVGVGGFLGIGQKNVALDFTSLHWGNRDNTPVLVAAVTKDELNTAPGFDTAALDQANGQPVDQTAQAPANGMAPAGPVDQTAQNAPAAGAMAPADQSAANQNQMAANPPAATGNTATAPNASDLQSIDVATISAQELMKATVYGANNEDVGEVGDVIVSQDGKIDAVILDVGGFLGLGEKPVAIGFDGLDIRKDANGALYVYTRFTKDQLEAAPQYDKNAYATSRDTMRLVAPM